MLDLTAAVLAGGLGTRLRAVLGNRPKALAEVNGRPFLGYLLEQLSRWGIRDAVLCTGVLGEQVESQFGTVFNSMRLRYSQEQVPLGTAGALRLALSNISSEEVLVLNGDSYCKVDLEQFWEWHRFRRSEATILLVENPDAERYGSVLIDADGHVVKFSEKCGNTGPALISAGVYIIKRSLLELIPEATCISLEREVFPSWINRNFYGYKAPGPFLDMGTPKSYAAADAFFAGMTCNEK